MGIDGGGTTVSRPIALRIDAGNAADCLSCPLPDCIYCMPEKPAFWLRRCCPIWVKENKPMAGPVQAKNDPRLTRCADCWHRKQDADFVRNEKTFKTCNECSVRKNATLRVRRGGPVGVTP